MPPSAEPLSRRAVRARQLAEQIATPDTVEEILEVVEPELAESGIPVAADVPVAEPQAEQSVTDADAFAEASRAFRFAAEEGPTVEVPQAETVDEPLPTDSMGDAHVAPRRGRGSSFRKLVTVGATVGVMGVAGLLAVSMTLPAEAVAAAQGVQASSATSLVASSSVPGATVADGEIQAFVASSDVQNESMARADDFSTVSMIEVAAEEGIKYSDSLYTNDVTAAIQWPFAVGVAMSSGYGTRWGQLHAGIDLVPGEGAPIQAIADGTVRIATESGGGYGVTVYIDHVIDGQVVTSHYSHMQYGSLRVAAGDKVKVGDIVGLVGNTGHSYGAHLHFEIIINGSTIDPLPWMQENAGRHSY